MLRARLTLGVLLLGIIMIPLPAHGAAGLEFLDNRPVVINLDEAEPGQRWSVHVLGVPADGQDITVHVVFEPAGVITIEQSSTAGLAGVTEFIIELQQQVEGSGELVAVGNGAVARRQISTEFGPADGAAAVGSLQFAGERIAPFTALVRIPPLEVPNASGRRAPAQPHQVGLLTSAGGAVAEVVRVGDQFAVRGVEAVGEYTGTVDLLPGRDDGTVQATVRVRDLPAWPLLVLLAGLAVAHALDRYQHRQRPQKLHEGRLARLREQARASERQTGGRLRIVARRDESGDYLLDQLIADARAAFHAHMSDAERELWEPGGAKYERLVATVDQFRQLCLEFKGLQDERDATIFAADLPDQRLISEALDRSVVGVALRERAIRSLADLADAQRPLRQGREHHELFDEIYYRIEDLRRHRSEEVRADAERLIEQLLHGADDLATVDAELRELDRRVGRGRLQKAPPPDLIPADPGDARPAPLSPPPPTPSRLRHALPVLTAAVVATTAVGLVVLSLAGRPTYLPSPDHGTGAVINEVVPTPTATATPPPTPAIPTAPVAAPADPPVYAGLQLSAPSTGQALWFGLMMPLLLLLAVGALGWLVVRWRQRRLRPQPDDPDPRSIESEIRREDLRFSFAAGVLVVLSGMSLLYVGNPTFGSAGDYLAVALWGAAVGEGFQLARRLWPGLPRV